MAFDCSHLSLQSLRVRWGTQTNVGGGHVALQLQGAQVHGARAKVGRWGHSGLALREGSVG